MVTGSPEAEAGAGPGSAARLAAPWYVHPAEDPRSWRRLLAGTSLGFAVINVASGPGSSGDPYYGPALAAGSHTPLVGYVDVSYGARPVDEVLDDVRVWLRRYPVCGVMLDCVPSVVRQGHWGLEVIDRVRELGAQLVVANPGLAPDPLIVERADVTCVAEYDWSFFQQWEPPALLAQLAPERLWMLVHNVPRTEQDRALELAASLGAGLAWATSGTMPNPWATLPARW